MLGPRTRTYAAGLRVFVVAAVAAGALTAVGGTAQAAVDGCSTFIGDGNRGYAHCSRGFGTYRVKAQCDSPKYPYSITVYGAWKTRKSIGDTPVSWVDGDKYACHLVKTSLDVR